VSAFTLLALGVPEATVVRDYTLTAHYLAGDILRAKRILGVLRLEYDKLAPVVATPPSLIGSVFDQLRAKHGSLDNYLTEVLQLTPAKRAQLRENFLL
jgi:protein-tyrosine phosphatase